MSANKLTVIDILNEYLAKGQQPPKELLQAAAELEGGKGTKVNGLVDPIQLLAGGTGIGAGFAERLTPKLGQMAANELIGTGLEQGVPKLIQMAQRGGSGLVQPLGRGQTNPFAGVMGKTEPLKGIQMPGGGVAAKGTSMLPGGIEHSEPLPGFKTSKLAGEDVDEMMAPLWFGPDADTTPGGPDALMQNLMAGTDTGDNSAEALMKMFGKITGPLPPQGATKDLPGSAGAGWSHLSQPTEKLTPFDAWQNAHNLVHDMGKTTTHLPGDVVDVGKAPNQHKTGELPMDNRTTSLEPFDIDEMTGKESPPTEDLLEAFAKNLGPKDTRLLPENSLYHGMNVFGHKSPKEALQSIANEGMRGGWFSEEPHQPFGPHFLATRPEDLPPLLIRSKQFNVDPEKEIIPRWKKMNTENLFSRMQMKGKSPRAELTPDLVKGRPATRSNWPNIHQLVGADEGGGGFPLSKGEGHVVDPSKLFLTNKTGETVGRMAPKSGENAIGKLWDKVRAFRNVLEKGTGNVANSVEKVWNENWGGDPDLKGLSKAQKLVKMQQFIDQGPPPEGSAIHAIWKKTAAQIMEALAEDMPK